MSVYDHLSYRPLIREWIDANRGWMSVREMARRLECSASWISQILNGKRDIDEGRIRDFTELMGLSDPEAAYFADLVALESSAEAVRAAAWSRVSAARRFAGSPELRDDAVRLFSRWIWGAVWQLARCEGFREDASWIAATLVPPVTEAEARDAIDGLLALGLLERDAEGRLHGIPDDRITAPILPLGELSRAIGQWHRHHLANIADRMRDTNPPLRVQLGMTFAVPSDLMREIHARLDALLREIGGMIESDERARDLVCHVEIGLVPVSRSTGTPAAPAPSSPTPPRTG